VRPRGKTLAVDVSSGVEEKLPNGSPRKGIKSPELISQFVAAVRAADVLIANQLAEKAFEHVRVPTT
jgi:phosphoribosylanthranilate isomerase